MSDTWQVFVLHNERETTLETGLLDFLKQNTRSAVRIEAGTLRRLDVRQLELLIVAAGTWAAAGLKFDVQGLGEAALRWLDRLAISPDTLQGRIEP